MLTQIIEVADVDPVPIFVTAEVGIESYFVTEDVVAAIQGAAGRLLAFDKVDFGETVYLSRFRRHPEHPRRPIRQHHRIQAPGPRGRG
jgi:hypothetical protein